MEQKVIICSFSRLIHRISDESIKGWLVKAMVSQTMVGPYANTTNGDVCVVFERESERQDTGPF